MKLNLSVTNNKVRNILIVLGSTISIVCLMVSTYLTDMLDDSNYVGYYNTSASIVTTYFNDNVNENQAKGYLNGFDEVPYNLFGNVESDMFYFGNYTTNITVTSISTIEDTMTLPSISDYGAVETTKLIAGRNITDEDKELNNKVILIHQSIALNIFGTSDVLNQKIEINDNIYEVVGVIEDTPDVLRYLSYIQYRPNDTVHLYVYTYCSVDTIISSALLFFDNDVSISNIKSFNDYYYNFNIYFTNSLNEIDIRSYYYDNSNEILNITLNIITIIMCLTASIVIIFSIKERASEFAIRKAIGATNKDILLMILYEIFLCFLVSVVISLIISVSIFVCISLITKKFLYIFIFNISLSTIVLPILIVESTVMLATFVPTFYLCNKKIINCLKVS